jgi:hypothetical protein
VVLALPEDMLRDEVEVEDRPCVPPLAEAPDPGAVQALFELLKEAASPVAIAAGDVPNEQDHRRGILEGDMDSGAGIGRARAAGDEGDSRTSGHLPVRIGHVADPALLPANDRVDLGRVVKRVENREEALARHGEDSVATLDSQLIDEDASARSGAGAIGHEGRLAPLGSRVTTRSQG